MSKPHLTLLSCSLGREGQQNLFPQDRAETHVAGVSEKEKNPLPQEEGQGTILRPDL